MDLGVVLLAYRLEVEGVGLQHEPGGDGVPIKIAIVHVVPGRTFAEETLPRQQVASRGIVNQGPTNDGATVRVGGCQDLPDCRRNCDIRLIARTGRYDQLGPVDLRGFELLFLRSVSIDEDDSVMLQELMHSRRAGLLDRDDWLHEATRRPYGKAQPHIAESTDDDVASG